jgi:hypothetical protein
VQAMLLGRAAIARARGAMVRHCGWKAQWFF